MPFWNHNQSGRLRGFRRMLCILVLALALSGFLTSPRPMLLAFVAPVRADA